MSRVLGVDFGSKRVGLAISDRDRRIASPLLILQRQSSEQDGRLIQRLIAEEKISLIVVGLPARTTGVEGSKAREARGYGAWLRELTGLKVLFWDERFTSVDAERLLLDAGLTKKQRAERIDMVAAQLMLQQFLDAGCPKDSAIEPLEDASTG